IINESLEVYKDVKIDGNLTVGGKLVGVDAEFDSLGVEGNPVMVWTGVYSVAPSDAKDGYVYQNTSDGKTYLYDKGEWKLLLN
ncbi:MAG TPA: hypothetical protein PK957_03705, partial [Candidatus Dojkabacteria bacterium]|nr:hypothetical protein [Candidatus Dojkabacteria bacterium]